MPGHPGAWIQHSLGIERLLHVRGPHAHRDSGCRELLERARPLIIIACLRQRKGTILSENEWKTIPWSDEGATKSPVEALIDIFVDLPTALFGSAQSSREEQRTAQGPDGRLQVILLLRRLRSWYLGLLEGRLESKHNNNDNSSSASIAHFKESDDKTLEAIALHAAICLITIQSAFARELTSMNCNNCLRRRPSWEDERKQFAQQSDSKPNALILPEMYHAALADACWLLDLQSSQAFVRQQAVQILVFLRHVWLATRHLSCPLATSFCRQMTHLFTQTATGLPLSLYQ